MSDTAITKLIAAYDEYVTLLGSEINLFGGIAVAHGMRPPPGNAERGAALRAEIEKLKAELCHADVLLEIANG